MRNATSEAPQKEEQRNKSAGSERIWSASKRDEGRTEESKGETEDVTGIGVCNLYKIYNEEKRDTCHFFLLRRRGIIVLI